MHMVKRSGILLIILLMICLSAFAEITSVSQLNSADMTVGVDQGSAAENIVREQLSQATIQYYNDKFLGYTAVAQGKLDAFVFDRRQMELTIEESLSGVHLLDETLGEPVQIAVGISPVTTIPDLKTKLNQFIAELRESGTLDDMFTRWVVNNDTELPTIELPGEAALHMVVGTSGIVPPYSYYTGTSLTGYDIELAYRFAAWLGATLEFKVYDYGSIINAAASGDVDCIMANLNVTPERAEVLPFSDILFETALGIMVRSSDDPSSETIGTARWQDYNGKKLGVLTGPLMEDAAAEYFPDSECLLFNSYPDCIAALLAGKIDAYLADGPSMKTIHAEQPEIDYIHDQITQNNYSFAFRKNDPKSAALCQELNEFLARCWADGTMQELDDIWFGVDEEKKIVDMSDLTGENGTIRIVTTSSDMPFSYIKDGKNVGYDIDLVVRFCRNRGYALELGDVDFAGRIPAIESGKYDFTTDMNVTPEREEQVLFSDPTSHGGIVLAVLSKDLENADATVTSEDNTATEKSFLSSIANSFEKTFIREKRYQLFLQGIGVTLLITVLSILFGTILGFLLFLLCRNGNALANTMTRFCLWLVQGMPMVVLLMILYYVIFASVNISGIAVAVIGFTLIFGAAVFGMLKIGVNAVDPRQYEAAYALGYTNHNTFFHIILPQAIPHVMPAWQGEIVSLIKATSIVGYIAVQDLTKMGDVVRSRTYEAFFPLIAITIIYFVLEGLLSFFAHLIQTRTDPRKRGHEQILKGVRL